MMADQVKALKKSAEEAVYEMGVPSCKTCLHRSGIGDFANCGVTGRFADISRKWSDECGHKARYWTPKPKSKLTILFEAIIERIKGNE